MPIRKNLYQAFEFLMESQYKGIPGVYVFDSGNPGPTLGVTVFTHGNEPSGLAVFDHFWKEAPLGNLLQKGRVIFVIANMQAAIRYMEAETFEQKQATRFHDINLNRLPPDALDSDENHYEIERLQEIYSILQEFDYGLDIHSTTAESDPMIIFLDEVQDDVIHNFPIDIILTGIDEVQIGKSLMTFFGGRDREIPVLAIEAGTHENAQSFMTAIASLTALLQNLGLIAGKTLKERRIYKKYHIVGSLLFPNDTYHMSKVFSMFEPIKKGQVIGKGDGDDVLSPIDGHAVMAPKGLKPSHYHEEIVWLSKPVVEIIV